MNFHAQYMSEEDRAFLWLCIYISTIYLFQQKYPFIYKILCRILTVYQPFRHV